MSIKNFLNSSAFIFIFLTITIVIVALVNQEISVIVGLLGFFFWFLREYSKQLLSKDLEKFKIQFSALHNRRSIVIEETYRKLDKVSRSFFALTHWFQEDGSETAEQKRRDRAQESFNDFSVYFSENAIFFDADLESKMDGLIKNLVNIWHDYHSAREENNVRQWSETFKALNEGEIPEIKKEIKGYLRKLLGVDN